MRRGTLLLVLALLFLSSSARAQLPGATLPGFPPPPGPIVLREGSEPPVGTTEPIVTVPLGTTVQSGFLVLVEPGTTNVTDPRFWSDVVVFTDPTHGIACQPGDAAQYAMLVSDAPGETGMSDADFAPIGVTIAQILACTAFTVYQQEGTSSSELNVYNADAATVYNIYSDTDVTPLNPTHFWSYHLRFPVLQPTPIALQDQLYPVFRPFVVDSLERLVNWVSKNGSAVRDTFVHYTWWNIQDKRAVGAYTEISNQFGSGRIYIDSVAFLLAPAWKNTDLPNTPVANHYLCYRAHGWRPQPQAYDMRDEWYGTVSYPDTLAYFCIPCAKNHAGTVFPVVDTTTHLAVYRVTPQSELFYPIIKDQFIAGNFFVQQFPDEYLFVPSTKGEVVGVEAEPRVPLHLALAAPAPNPARLATKVVLALPQAMSVRLDVYDIAGRRVRTLVSGVLDAGAHPVTWDLRSSAGVRVRPGIYALRLVAGSTRLGRTIVVMN